MWFSALFIISSTVNFVSLFCIKIDVNETYKGVTAISINSAIKLAIEHFKNHPDSEIVIYIAPGEHKIAFNNKEDYAINFSNIKPGIRKSIQLINVQCSFLLAGPKGRLIFKGDSSYTTTIISDNFHNTIIGKNVSRLTVSDLHFSKYKVIRLLILQSFNPKIQGSYMHPKSGEGTINPDSAQWDCIDGFSKFVY